MVKTADGAVLHVEQHGSGRPVVLIHGVLMSSRFFAPQVERLAPHCRLVLFDLPGHGQSEARPSGHSVAAYSEALHRLMETLDLRDAVLVGWSMGAFVMWDYLHNHGQRRTKRCVVVDELASDFRWPDHPHGALDLPSLCSLMAQIQSDYAGLAETLLDAMFVTPPQGPERAWMKREILRVSPANASAIFFDQTMRDFRELLPSLTTPCLVTAGADEKLVTLAGAKDLAARLPNAHLHLLGLRKLGSGLTVLPVIRRSFATRYSTMRCVSVPWRFAATSVCNSPALQPLGPHFWWWWPVFYAQVDAWPLSSQPQSATPPTLRRSLTTS